MPRLIAHLKFACKGSVCHPEQHGCDNVITVPEGTTRLKLRQSVFNRYGSWAGWGTTEELTVIPVGATTCAVCREEHAIERTCRAFAFGSGFVAAEDAGTSAKLLARLIVNELPCCEECRSTLVSGLKRENVRRSAYVFNGWGNRVDPRCVGSAIQCDELADAETLDAMARDRVLMDADRGFSLRDDDVDLTEEGGACLTKEEFLARFHKRNEEARGTSSPCCWYTFENVM